ncbi:MAG: BTAD domain-containing putative transcriptional regulator [Chloroflexota bacterium]
MPDQAIYLLGAPQIQQAQETVTLSHQKALALLAYLATTQRPHSRDALCGLLWPDEEQSKARAELRRMLWSINKGLGKGWLDSSRQTVGLAKTAVIYTDIHHFDQLLTSWQQHKPNSTVLYAQGAADLSEAIDLYQDDFMAGFALPDSDNFERWQQQQAAEKRQALEGALDKLLHWHVAENNPELIKIAQRRLQLDPTHEPTHRLLMIHYAKAQQPTAALTQYQHCVDALASELALEPSDETTALYQQIKNGRSANSWRPNNNWQTLSPTYQAPIPSQQENKPESPIPQSPISRPHNLPAQITPFVGRRAEIKQIVELLSDDNVRFLSIIAPGGMGKTRLALEIGQQLLVSFADGVFVVELAPLEDGNSIIPALAEAVGYAFQQNGRSQKQQILDYLASKQTLLLLDNFEHLLGNAALVPELLQAAPQLKVLVTSRERLRQHGETLLALGGMGLPDWHSTATAFNYASIQLFQQTARLARPDFTVTTTNLSDITRICRLVAGMPLGIVLAASWMSLLSAKEIVSEIQQGLDILESDGGEVAERQRSIRVVFDSAWHMLNAKEQHVFMKMSLFHGSFSREAAQKVTGANLRQLQSLINKSLIYRESASGRYQMHELLRQYAKEQLAAGGQMEAAAAEYIHYYLTFLAEQAAALKGHEQLATLRQLENDFDNIRTSWLSAIANRDYDLLDTAVEAMYLFCFLTSRLEDGKDLFDTARFGQVAATTAHPVWHRFSIRFYSTEVETAVLIDTFQQTLVHAQQRNDLAETAFCYSTLAAIEQNVTQNTSQAIEHYEQATALYRQLDERYHLANTLSKLAQAYRMVGQADKTAQHVNEAYTIQQQIGDRLGEAESLRALGFAANLRGNYQQSLEYLESALEIWQNANYLSGQAAGLAFAGDHYYRGGQLDYGRQLMQKGLKIALDIADYSAQAFCYVLLAGLETISSNLDLAEDYLSKAHAIETDPFRQAGTGNPFLQWLTHSVQMFLNATNGQLDTIRSSLPFAFFFATQVASHSALTSFMTLAALLRADKEQYAQATELLGLIFAQPTDSNGWMNGWATLTQLQNDLQAKLGKTGYQAAWQRGQSLDLYETAQALVTELQG